MPDPYPPALKAQAIAVSLPKSTQPTTTTRARATTLAQAPSTTAAVGTPSASVRASAAATPGVPPATLTAATAVHPVTLPGKMPATALALLAAVALALLLVALGAPLHDSAAGNAAAAAADHLRAVGVGALLDTLPEPLRKSVTDDGFLAAFTQSLLLILACELGDRTFFVAAVLAMKAPRIVVFAGAIAALALMTVLSALIGKAFPMLLDKKYTSIASAILFAYFGVQLLRDWWGMRNQPESENEELAEVEQELSGSADKGINKPVLSSSLASIPFITLLSPIFIKSFTMTGLAEWGDRSQIATIALAAAQNIYGVILGGVLGHAICTSLAVIGGRLLATRISEKAVALTGGILFLSFAVLTLSGKLE
jgi:Ca2+/H+ antiporter, TMEM165/GDT1 family